MDRGGRSERNNTHRSAYPCISSVCGAGTTLPNISACGHAGASVHARAGRSTSGSVKQPSMTAPAGRVLDGVVKSRSHSTTDSMLALTAHASANSASNVRAHTKRIRYCVTPARSTMRLVLALCALLAGSAALVGAKYVTEFEWDSSMPIPQDMRRECGAVFAGFNGTEVPPCLTGVLENPVSVIGFGNCDSTQLRWFNTPVVQLRDRRSFYADRPVYWTDMALRVVRRLS